MAYCPQAISSKEDTAQLTLSKTAFPEKPVFSYTVKKNDILSSLIRQISGVTEKDIPRYYRMIKELNPQIEDLNKLETGQTIILPGRGFSTAGHQSSTDSNVGSSLPKGSGQQIYQVKKGDSLIRIVHRELKITSRTQPAMLAIKSLNPVIQDANKIYVGQMIQLPGIQAATKGGLAQSHPDQASLLPLSSFRTEKKASSGNIDLVPPPETSSHQEATSPEPKQTMVLPLSERLAVIRRLINQVNGNMITSGNYYLPVSGTGQITIDCSMIPVIELDGQNTIFIDIKGLSGNHLKKIIKGSWNNYHFVKIEDKDDIIVILKKIFNSVQSHEISRAQKPVLVSSLPPLEILADWIITPKEKNQKPTKTLALRFVYENTPLLPQAVLDCAGRQSLMITEISPEKGLISKSVEIYSLPPAMILPASSAREFSYALLSRLNISGEKDADIRVFSIARDGFNLSIKADLLVERGKNKTAIFSRDLPLQFINILQNAGYELIFLSDQDAPSQKMEKILRGFHFVFTTGYFSFSGLDKNHPPYHFGFDGFKIKADRDIYAVNFAFNQELRGLIREAWSADIIQY